MRKKINFIFLIVSLLLFSTSAVHAQQSDVLFTRTLQVGSTGKEVSLLQEFLKRYSNVYPEGLVTGYFGVLTEDAVMRFQTSEGIDAVGIVGPITRDKLNSLVTPGFPDTAATSSFTQTISAGTLTVDIVDASLVAVVSPSVAMASVAFGFSCQATTGTFGTATEQIYVKNPDAADNGWVVSLAAAAPTAIWDSAGTDYDFNDPTTAGCADGADTDLFAGQMTVDPSVSTLAVGACSSCVVTNITKGSSAAFSETGTVLNSITILTGAATSNDIGDWKLTGVAISQTIPAEQPAAADYTIPLTLSIVAS